MRFHTKVIILFSLITIIKAEESLRPSSQSTGFVSTHRQDDTDDLDSSPAEAVNYRSQAYEYDEDEEVKPYTEHQNRRQQVFIRKVVNKKQILDELEEEEEPDRLSILLQKSNFNCDGRTGYYADEGLSCEVFHYCQENQKHSWICPEGFAFHQVHLICMPPSGENICEQSSKYHIVNDYLYKPINVEEHQSKPNITLRYSERYYPENFYNDERQDRQSYQHDRQRQPIQVGIRNAPTTAPYRQPVQAQQQNVYRSPEEINISLQQRRPQIIFNPTTARYEDEEYNYDK